MKEKGGEQDEWLESLIVAGEQAIEQHRYDILMASSTRFNDAIFEIARMPRLKKIQHDLQEYLLRFRSLSLLGEYNNRRIQAVSEHKAILAAMRIKDELLIREMISEHLEQSKRYVIGLLPYFDGHQDPEAASRRTAAPTKKFKCDLAHIYCAPFALSWGGNERQIRR